ncbi:hypothetical protein AMECASPLE_033259 [Ameca splendens]|uniref:Uncharacterized protein n=1 Tax=Ameca splendens TaxID=208324 RepID=A0ABV1AEN3_9TELE
MKQGPDSKFVMCLPLKSELLLRCAFPISRGPVVTSSFPGLAYCTIFLCILQTATLKSLEQFSGGYLGIHRGQAATIDH